MTSTDIAVREQQALELIDSGAFADRVQPLLPDTVPMRRFLSVAKTAIRNNPDLVDADQRTLMGALIRCAQDGLLPDGREAALGVFGSKVTYMPVIGGLRKNLAEHGWTLKTRCIYSNDDFEYVEEPPLIRHVPVRPGGERGVRIGAYAVARHQDGRRLQIVLDEEEIAKRKAKAKTKNIWNEWPDAMAEKSAGHAIFDEIPRAERDRMTVPSDNGVDSAVELLYGPDGHEFPVRAPQTAATGTAAVVASPPQSDAQKDDGGSQQAGDAGASPAPGTDDDDPEPQPAAQQELAVPDLEELAATVVPGGGSWGGKTLGDVFETQDGREWIVWALRNKGRLDADFYAILEQFAAAQLAAEREAA